ncbi:MAG: ABC transporter ATP-binding protein [Oceanidesulfovibrio sp.]
MSLLEINNMTQRFGGLTAVSDFSVHLNEGELCGLIGPNGAGKTTIFNLVSGFYTPTLGAIEFAGEKITGMKPHKVTGKGIARTFQNIRLWHDMTVLDNIRVSQHYHLGYGFLDAVFRLPRYNRRTEELDSWVYEILDALELTRYAEEYPKNLPYGLRRRVEIARALSTKPRLLLLDEPAAGLNTADLDGLISLIRWIYENFEITIWMIEHQMQVVMTLCQRIQVIDFGATIAQGTPHEIQNNPEVIKAYLGDDTI